jgi:hypothetical protein
VAVERRKREAAEGVDKAEFESYAKGNKEMAKETQAGIVKPSKAAVKAKAGNNAGSDEEESDRGKKKKGGAKGGGGKKGEEEEEVSSRDAKKDARRAKAGANKGQARGNIRGAGGSKAAGSDSDEPEERGAAKGKAAAAKAAPPAKKGAGKRQVGGKEETLRMPLRQISEEVEKWLKGAGHTRCPPELVVLLVAQIGPAVQRHFAEASQSLLSGNSAVKRKLRDAATTKLTDLYTHLCVFQRAMESLLPVGEAVGGGKDTSKDGSKEAGKGKNKEGEAGAASKGKDKAETEEQPWLVAAHTALGKHLLKTLGTQAIDVLIRLEASEAKVQGGEETKFEALFDTPLQGEDRDRFLEGIRGDRAKALRSLIMQRDAGIFLSRLQEVAGELELVLKPPDKSAERALIFNMRRGLMAQLETEAKPMLVLHYTALVLHSKASGFVLHAPSRVISAAVRWLQDRVEPACAKALSRYDELVRTFLEQEEAGEDTVLIKSDLASGLENIRKFGLNPKDVMLPESS